MKKILGLCCLLLSIMVASCSSTMNVEDCKSERIEKQMILPDGAVADVSFHKNWWGDASASKMENALRKRITSEGKQIAGVKEETDEYLGYGNIIHKATENEYIKKICDVMSECGATYGVAYVDFGQRTRTYVFTYFPKGERLDSPVPELRNSFFDYFYGGHEFYIAYRNKDTAEQDRLNKINAETMKNNLNEYLREQKGVENQRNLNGN